MYPKEERCVGCEQEEEVRENGVDGERRTGIVAARRDGWW